jgi:hypothetical protein
MSADTEQMLAIHPLHNLFSPAKVHLARRSREMWRSSRLVDRRRKGQPYSPASNCSIYARNPYSSPEQLEQRENDGLVGGGGGIRTHETLSGLTVFKTAGVNHFPTPPN